MVNVRWLIAAALIAQAGAPRPPTNLRFATQPTGCQSGDVGVPPNCFPAPPAPLSAGKQWKVTYSEEFNEAALDVTKLSPCFDWNFGACTASFNTGKERYLASRSK